VARNARVQGSGFPARLDAKSKVALVYGQMTEPPGARPSAWGLSGPHRRRVFPRPRRAGTWLAVHRQHFSGSRRPVSEVSALLRPHAVGGRLPAEPGDRNGANYRSASRRPRRGSITSVAGRSNVPADDYTDPAPATTFAHLDATTQLSRSIFRNGHLPGGGSVGFDIGASSIHAFWAKSTTTSRNRSSRSCSGTKNPAGTSSRFLGVLTNSPTTTS